MKIAYSNIYKGKLKPNKTANIFGLPEANILHSHAMVAYNTRT